MRLIFVSYPVRVYDDIALLIYPMTDIMIIPFLTSNFTIAMKEWCYLCISDFAKYDLLSMFMTVT